MLGSHDVNMMGSCLHHGIPTGTAFEDSNCMKA